MVLQEGLQHAARLHTYTHDFRRRRVTVGWQHADETRAVLRCILLPDLNANLLPLARARGRESVAVAVLQFIPAQKITNVKYDHHASQAEGGEGDEHAPLPATGARALRSEMRTFKPELLFTAAHLVKQISERHVIKRWLRDGLCRA